MSFKPLCAERCSEKRDALAAGDFCLRAGARHPERRDPKLSLPQKEERIEQSNTAIKCLKMRQNLKEKKSQLFLNHAVSVLTERHLPISNQ